MNTVNNKRSNNTKTVLRHALYDLLIEGKKIEQITVKEICKKASINRSTFYEHYKDSTDLLDSVKNRLINKTNEYIANIKKETLETNPMFLPLFLKYVKDHDRAFRTLLLNKSTGFEEMMIEQTASLLMENDRIEINPKVANYINTFIKKGSVGVLIEWIQSNYKITENELSKILYTFSSSLLAASY